MEKRDKIYEGKAKILYTTDDPDMVIQYFKDDATAFNAAKKGSIDQKGVINNKISTKIFEMLESRGIKTHYVKTLNDREMLVKKVTIVPLEVIIRNRAAGSLCRLLGLPEGTTLACPILEFCYKEDKLGDPMINEYHIRALKYATDSEIEKIKTMVFKINDAMREFFAKLNIELIDFKLEFGRYKNDIILPFVGDWNRREAR
jgi:phosphoribosylaminoimidazole-succinocarboxamide synthase